MDIEPAMLVQFQTTILGYSQMVDVKTGLKMSNSAKI